MSKITTATLVSTTALSIGLYISHQNIDIKKCYQNISNFESLDSVCSNMKGIMQGAIEKVGTIIKNYNENEDDDEDVDDDENIDIEKQWKTIMEKLEKSEKNIKKEAKRFVKNSGNINDNLSKKKVDETLNQISEMKTIFRDVANKRQDTDKQEALLNIVKIMKIAPLFGDALVGVEMILKFNIKRGEVQKEVIDCVGLIFQLLNCLDSEIKEYKIHDLNLKKAELKAIKKLLNKIEELSKIIAKIERKKVKIFFSASEDKKALLTWKREVNSILKQRKFYKIMKTFVNVERLIIDSKIIKELGIANLTVGTITLVLVAKMFTIITKQPQFVLFFHRMAKLSIKVLTQPISVYRQYVLTHGKSLILMV